MIAKNVEAALSVHMVNSSGYVWNAEAAAYAHTAEKNTYARNVEANVFVPMA